jgi:hypothetical protein
VEKGVTAKNVLLTQIILTRIALEKHLKKVAGNELCCIFAPTVPVLHTIRTAGGSFFKESSKKH